MSTTINDVQKYWNNQPCNIKHSSEIQNTKKYFDEIEQRKYFVEPHIPEFAEFNKWRGKKVLEIGCGIGTDAINFAKNNCEYYAIELSNRSLEITKKRFEVYKLRGSFYNFNAEDDNEMSKLGNETFDLIYSFGVIHHSCHPQQIINNAYKLLKPNGIFKLMVYASHSWKKIMIDNYDCQFEAQKNCPIANTYTKDEITNMLRDFKILSIYQDHIFPYKIDKYKKHIYEREDYFEVMPPKLFDILQKELGWHLCITCQK